MIEAVSGVVRVLFGEVLLFCQVRSSLDLSVKWLRGDKLVMTERVGVTLGTFRRNLTYAFWVDKTETVDDIYKCNVSPVDYPNDVVESSNIQVVSIRPPVSVTLKVLNRGVPLLYQRPVYSPDELISLECTVSEPTGADSNVTLYKTTLDSQLISIKTCEPKQPCNISYRTMREDTLSRLRCVAGNEVTLDYYSQVYSNIYVFSVIRSPASVKPTITLDYGNSLDAKEYSKHRVQCVTDSEAIPVVTVELYQGEQVFRATRV